jgi:PAS domain S-box-containing protein
MKSRYTGSNFPVLFLSGYFLWIAVTGFPASLLAQNSGQEQIQDNRNSAAFTRYIDSLNTLSRDLIFVNVNKAALLAGEALNRSLNENYLSGQAHAYRVLASIYYNLKSIYPAAEYLNRAMKIFEFLNDSAGIANCYLTQGFAYRNEEKYEKAIETNRKALHLFERLDLTDRTGVAAHNLAESYFFAGQYSEARKTIDEALHLNEATGNLPVLSSCYRIKGLIEKAAGNLDAAEKAFQATLSISDQLGSQAQKIATMEALIQLADIYGSKSRTELQKKYLLRAASFSEQELLTDYIHPVYNRLISLEAQQRNPDGIIRLIQHLDDVYRQIASQKRKQDEELEKIVMHIYQFHEIKRTELEKQAGIQNRRLQEQNLLLKIVFLAAAILVALLLILISTLRKQKKMQQYLRQSEQHLREVLSSTADYIYVIDKNYRIILINEAAEKNISLAWGKPVKTGAHILELIPKERRDAIQDYFERAFRGETVEYELHRQIPGIPEWVQVSFRPVKNETGDITGVTVLTKDLTEKKIAELQLRENENRLRTIINSEPECIKLLNSQNEIIEMNPAGLQMIVADSFEAIKSHNVTTLILPPYRQAFMQLTRRVFRGESGTLQFEIKGLKGTQRWLETHAVPLKNTSGDVIALLSITRDITESKKTEMKLLREMELSDSIINSLPGVFYLFDEELRFLRWNKNFETVTGYTSDELSNMKPTDFFEENEKNLIKEKIEEVFQRGTAEVEAAFRTKDGRLIPYYFNGKKIIFDNKICLIGMGIDITGRKKAEQELQQAYTRFELISRTTNDAIWEWDLETGRLWSNETHQLLYGLTVQDPVPDSAEWTKRIHPDDRQRIVEAQEKALSSGTNVFITEYRFLVHEKGYRDIYDRCYIVRNKEGKAIRMMGSMMDITERKRTEELIRSNEETLRTIMHSALDAIITMDSKGCVEIWTPRAEQIFGWKESEVTGQKLSQFIIPLHYRQRHEDGLKKFLQTGKGPMLNKIVEMSAINKEGDEFPVELSIVPIRKNEKIFFCSFIRDISERKKKEEEIRMANERYNIISLATNDVVWDWDLETNQIWWNDAYYHQFGYQRDSSSGTIDCWYRALHPDDKERVLEGIHRAIQSTEPYWADEYRFLKADGTICQIYDRGYIIRDEAGRSIRMIGAKADITEMKTATEKLRLSEEKYRMLFNKNPMPMWVLDFETMKFLAVNEAALHHYGYSEKEFLAMTALDIRPAEDRQLFIEKHQPRRSSLYRSGIWRHCKKSGEIMDVEIHAYPLLYEGRAAELVLVNDVTEKLKTEILLQQSYEDIRCLASYLQDVRENERISIAREIHDELGQQLTVLKMDIAWLNRKIPEKNASLEAKMKELLEMVDQTIRSVRKISSDLRPSVLDDLGLVAALEWQSREFEKKSGIQTRFKADLTDMNLPHQLATGLFRIYQESLTNVARHAGANRVHATLSHHNGTLTFLIEDNGKGFEIDLLKKKKTLGILGMRERVSLMGGHFRITSNPGQGTRIEISIPLNEQIHKQTKT